MESDSPGEFGRLLRQLRESAALSQEELAERANLSAKAIGALERGERRRPYPNTVRALCAGLELDEANAAALVGALRPDSGDLATAGSVRQTVLVPAAPMLGRSEELAEVVARLDTPAVRVVTITGMGGVGKTRLAIDVTCELRRAGREVVEVELASVPRVDLVMPSIGRAVGLQASSDDLIGSIAGAIAGRAPILLLDNVEHVLGVATEIAELVLRAPDVTVLATSRAPLRIRSEHEFLLGPLAVPTAHRELARIAASPAVRMFVDRVRRVSPSFEVTQSNADAVAEICRRLDGLPLAIELAAPHMRYLTAPQLLDRLGHAVGSARLRDLPERQQTLKATLDWSYDLLTGDEQDVLRSLSVFAGGFDLDAAVEVAAGPGRDVVSALNGLVEQSLIVGPDPSSPAGSRMRMLEPVRDHVNASLSIEDAAELADRHASYFASMCSAARAGLRSNDLANWLDRLAVEHANLHAALATQLENGRLNDAAELGSDTWLYWALRGHAGQGVVWWERVLHAGRDGGLDARGRAAANVTLAGLRLATGDSEGVRVHGAAAVEAGRAAQDPAVLFEALLLACMGAIFTGDLRSASAKAEELTEVFTDHDDPWVHANAYIAAAQVALLHGNLDASAAALDSAERLARDGAGAFVLGTALNMQTTLALIVDDDDAALRSASEALRLSNEIGMAWTLVYTLSDLATLAARRHRPDVAVVLFGAADGTAETSLLTVAFRPDREAADRHLAEVRRRLSAEEFAQCWERGRRLGVEDVAMVIAEISEGPAPS